MPGLGWWALDPTDDQAAGERHVVVGQGRDYDDVLPMRGVYYGDTDHVLAADPEIRQQIDQKHPALSCGL